MPSGKTHDRITLWSLPWVVVLALLLTRNGNLSLIVAGAFLFSGLMFGPDLDIYSVQFKRWGILRIIWLPYQNLVRHRSLISHGLIIGTIARSIYLLSFLSLLGVFAITIAQLIAGFYWNWQEFAQILVNSASKDYRQESIALFVGLELGATSHTLSDAIDSACKRYQKNNPQPQQKKKSRRKPTRRRK